MTVFGLILMTIGLIFFAATVLGVHRFPDCYTRMHAASKGDTMSTILFILGMIVVAFDGFDALNLVRTAKLLAIIFFLFITSPTASHSLASAGFRRGIKPWRRGAKPGAVDE